MMKQTSVRPFHGNCLGTYATVAISVIALVQIQRMWSPPLLVGLFLTAIAVAMIRSGIVGFMG